MGILYFIKPSNNLKANNARGSITFGAIILFIFTGVAFLFNFILSFAATRLLAPAAYGKFYASIAAINISISAVQAIGFFHSRDASALFVKEGYEGSIAYSKAFFHQFFKLNLIVAFILFLSFCIGYLSNFFESFILSLSIVFCVFFNYLVYILRETLQSLNVFFFMGLLNMIWMALRCGLGIIFIYCLGTAWSGIAGITLSSIVVGSFLYCSLFRGVKNISKKRYDHIVRPFRKKIFFIVSFLLIAWVGNFDIIVAYRALTPIALGSYCASALLPKALFLLLLTLGQVLFPRLVHSKASKLKQEDRILITFKISLLTITIVAGSIFFIYFFGSIFTKGILYIKGCQPDIMLFLCFAVLPASMIRILVLTQLSRGKDRHPLFLILAFFLYLIYMLIFMNNITPYDMAISYAIFCILLMILYGLLCLLTLFNQNVVNVRSI